MQFGVTLPNLGDFADVRLLSQLARDAEEAGWDGFFLWDHVLLWPAPMVDPWVALAGIALATERVRIGTLVTPLPRRRPVKLAREAVSIDRLSNGRLILGVGIGAGAWEWGYLGEETDLKVRGAMLDEGLELLTRLWTGAPVLFEGQYYKFGGDLGPGRPEAAPTPFLPAPVQSPRIPVWVGGTWPRKRPFRRAARWDGVVPLMEGKRFGEYMSPGDVQEVVAYIREQRTSDAPFDVVVSGHTDGDDRASASGAVRTHEDAGATWWLEDISPWPFGWNWQGPWPVEAMRARILQGPPTR